MASLSWTRDSGISNLWWGVFKRCDGGGGGGGGGDGLEYKGVHLDASSKEEEASFLVLSAPDNESELSDGELLSLRGKVTNGFDCSTIIKDGAVRFSILA